MMDIKRILKDHEIWLIGNGQGKRANLRGEDLRGEDLRGADLRIASLRGADLRGADLRGADLRMVSLRGADLRGADLRGADLRGADLRGAYLYSIVGKTIYTLNSIKHPAFYIKEDDIINIGCKSLTYTDWVNCGENIGVSEGYSPEEVVIYLNWMKAIKAL